MEDKLIEKNSSKPTSKKSNNKKTCIKKERKVEGKPCKKGECKKIFSPIIIDEELLKNSKKIEIKQDDDFTIVDLREFGSKLFSSKNKTFNSLIDSIAREIKNDNYGIARDLANINLNCNEFNGYEKGCLGSICGYIAAYLVPLHLQQAKEFIQKHTS